MSFFKIIISPTSFSSYILKNKNCKKLNNIKNYNYKAQSYKLKLRQNNNAIKIKYNKLNLINANYYKLQFLNLLEQENLNFVLKYLKVHKNDILNLIDKIGGLEKLKDVKFRSKNNECVIQTLANSMAFKTLYSYKFNAISAFNNVKNGIKIYKKEENAFYLLYLQALFVWLNLFIYEMQVNEKQIHKGKNLKKVKFRKEDKFNYFKTYGVLIYNKNARAVTASVDEKKLINSVSLSLNYFYDIKEKISIIINWFNFLTVKKIV